MNIAAAASAAELSALQVRVREQRDHRLVAICGLALHGRISADLLAPLSRETREELTSWTPTRAREYLQPLLRLDTVLPAPPPPQEAPVGDLMEKPVPAFVNVNRAEQLLDLLETGMVRLQRAVHMTPKQRDRAVVRWSRRVARAALTAEHVHEVAEFLESLFERDPDELRERAAIAREDGEHERAQRLEDDAAKIEARRGNG